MKNQMNLGSRVLATWPTHPNVYSGTYVGVVTAVAGHVVTVHVAYVGVSTPEAVKIDVETWRDLTNDTPLDNLQVMPSPYKPTKER